MNKTKIITTIIICLTLGILIINFIPMGRYDKSSTTVLSELHISDSSILWDTPVHLTDNDLDDRSPKISNGMVVWSANDGTSIDDKEIFFYNGTTILQLTDNTVDDNDPQIHNGIVVWYARDSTYWNDYEIYLYDGNTTLQLTDNHEDDIGPQTHNGMVTWYYGRPAEPYSYTYGYEIYLYNGSTIQRITNNQYKDDTHPKIHNGMITWIQREKEYSYYLSPEIFFYNGTTILQLTDDGGLIDYPQIDNGMVTWCGAEDRFSDDEIFLFNGTTTLQLTDNEEDDVNPQIDNGMVTWLRWLYEGSLYVGGEIYLYNGTSTQLLFNNEALDLYTEPQLYNGMVLWSCRVEDGGNSEILLYDGTTILELTDTVKKDYFHSQIDDGFITGEFQDGNDFEIFLLGQDITPPVFDIEVDDVAYEEGTTGHNISWTASDTYPESYSISMNGVEFDSGNWSDQEIYINIDGLSEGMYAYVCTLYDQAGLSSSDTVLVLVYGEGGEPAISRLQLELSGAFDYLLKEKIHIQLACLLTNSLSGDPESGASVTFDIYSPDGSILVSGTFIEDAEPGLYKYTMPETIKDLDLPKGIYLVYAKAVALDGTEAVDMIQFHIDPPSDSPSTDAYFGLISLSLWGMSVTMFTIIWFRRRTKGA